ncbi:MAG: hypothetical protein ACI9H1_001545 [Polaribacter sp.]|jgi:hypothetical protein|tara:strand:+ start:202 stop:1350 length:1149 start_codon:yes stop_codon:yes gene_type:complete
MKTKISILIIFLVLFTKGCATYNYKIETNFIEGIWVFDSEINNLYIKDTSSIYKTQRPIIFDFKKNNNLTIKNYGIKDTTLNVKWFFKSDSIINIDSLDYKLYELKKNKLSIIDFNRADTFWINFRKPKNIKINYSKEQIENILTSNIWKNKDKTENLEYNSFEFFKNKSMIYRYKMSQKDSIDYIQNENWGIAEYKDYFFLYNYTDFFLGKGNWEQINQILKISPESYSLEDNNNKIYENNFYPKIDKKKNINILGKWKSKNSKDKNYGEFISENQIKNGNIKLFEGELDIKITNEFIEFKIDTLVLAKYQWQIGKDNKTLLMEKKYEGEISKDSFIFLADIIEKNENRFKLHLFENQFLTGFDKPYSIIVNKIQTFERNE